MKEHLYFKLHKPVSVVSQFVREQKRKKKLLGDLYDFPKGVMAVGRLDEKSEGLLLLTTNGKESHRICSSGVEKEYFVQIDGLITEEAIEELNSGVEIGIKGQKYITKNSLSFKLKITPDFGENGWRIRDERHGPTSWISITITEGKFRQVRKMTAAVGFPTLRLVRVRIGDILLDGLASGEVKKLPHF
jgi:23S rRNA pseudouridine2457 synthase